jgi:hypothetical protein
VALRTAVRVYLVRLPGTSQQLLLAHPELDLTNLALIAVQREHLTERNANIPAILPTVWAKLGQLSRAEALAHSIPDPTRTRERRC